MITYTTKTLLITLLALWLCLFEASPGYALTLNEAQKLLASDGAAGDEYGISVSISGDTAVIGAFADDDNANGAGSAYVYNRNSAGTWNEQQKLTASDAAVGDRFGISVSISGETIVIGAQFDDDNGNSSGSAYVFVRDGSGMWTEQQKLTASDGATGDDFGISSSVSGDTAVFGAWKDDDNGSETGSAYVFVRDGSGVWSEQQKLIASDGTGGDTFGISVSIYGNSALIGAWQDDGNNGSAYVFVRDGSGVWLEQQKLTTSNATSGARLGISVSIFADTAVIGADKDNGTGSAYVFLRDGSGIWSEQQKLTGSEATTGDEIGSSVSISGDTAVIGAIRANDNGSQSGSAYVFVRDGSGVWNERNRLEPSDATAGDWFGNSVSIWGDTAVIGARLDGNNGNQSGSAYVFDTSDSNTNLLTLEKLINHRNRPTLDTAAQLLAGTRYRVDYKVTNNSSNRLTQVKVYEGGELVCNLYALEPGESKQRYSCSNNQDVLVGTSNIDATVTAKVAASNEELVSQTNAYYIGHSNVPGILNVTHYVNDKNADTQASAVDVTDNKAEFLFRVKNTGLIELYRVKTYHDPASPINSGWQQQCYIGTLLPGQVRYCKRTISVNRIGLNKAFGRVQSVNANVSATGFVNSANPTYFNVVLP